LAVGTDSLDDVFDLTGMEVDGYGYFGDAYVGKAVCAMADLACEVDVAGAGLGVAYVAYAVFLCAGTVVDFVEQMCLGKEYEGAVEGGTVDCGQHLFEGGEGEGVGYVAYVVPDE